MLQAFVTKTYVEEYKYKDNLVMIVELLADQCHRQGDLVEITLKFIYSKLPIMTR